MELKISRKVRTPKYTEGMFFVDDDYFGPTLEDPVRNIPVDGKVWGDTAIPAGRYRVTLRHSNRFKRIMPAINAVPFFEGILIHSGVTTEHTHGCPLLGTSRRGPGNLEGSLTEKLIRTIMRARGDVWITVENAFPGAEEFDQVINQVAALPKPLMGNGCGGAGSFIDPPDFFPSACGKHDDAYKVGGDEVKRMSNDSAFMADMNKEAAAAPNVWIRLGKSICVPFYHVAVRVFGWKYISRKGAKDGTA